MGVRGYKSLPMYRSVLYVAYNRVYWGREGLDGCGREGVGAQVRGMRLLLAL